MKQVTPGSNRVLQARESRLRLIYGLAIALVVAGLDQASKSWLLATLPPGNFVIVTDFFNLVRAMNRGISFGLFNNSDDANRFVFSVLAAGLISALIVWLYRCHNTLFAVAIGFVIGGAVGNVLDRLHYGGVVDFLDFHLGDVHFWAFNLADSAITIGVALMIIDSLLGRLRGRK
jgi:signal peptidase II